LFCPIFFFRLQIFFGRDKRVRIGDFGLSTLDDNAGDLVTSTAMVSVTTPNSKVFGTLPYSAPEFDPSSKFDVGTKSDVFSLGIIFLELFQPMTTHMERASILTRARTARELPEQITRDYPEVANVILLCLHPNPAMRPSVVNLLATGPLAVSATITVDLVNTLQRELAMARMLLEKRTEEVQKLTMMLQLKPSLPSSESVD
jgi:translation initiation factor 2-alpha kinase 1